MAEQFYTLLTKIGKAKIANATALGNKVNFTTLKVGDGKGKYYNPTEEQEDLVNEVWQGNINSIRVDEDNPNWVVIEVIIPSSIGGFMIREAGIFDDENNMIAIGKYPETYKPQAQDGSTKDLVIKMILEVSNTSSVTLKIDPTVILATQKDIQLLSNNFSNFKKSVESSLSETTKEIDSLKSSVGSGKDSLYSAIIGKKVTPRSKDFDDLKSAIDNIKLGQGNAQPSEVLSGRTFTNDSGIMQNGAMTNYGSKIITPTTYNQSFGSGFYSGINIKGDSNLKPENIRSGFNIFGITGNLKPTKIFQGHLNYQYWEVKDKYEEKVVIDDGEYDMTFNIGCKPIFACVFGISTYISGSDIHHRYKLGFIQSSVDVGYYLNKKFGMQNDERTYSEGFSNTFSILFTETGFKIKLENDREMLETKGLTWFILAE